MSEKMSFSIVSGNVLKEYRTLKGLKQEDLADMLNVVRQTIVTWESKEKVKIPKKLADEMLKTIADDKKGAVMTIKSHDFDGVNNEVVAALLTELRDEYKKNEALKDKYIRMLEEEIDKLKTEKG